METLYFIYPVAMTVESKRRRAEIANGRSGMLEQLTKTSLEAQKDEQTRNVRLTPAVRHQDRFKVLQTVFGDEGVSCMDDCRKQHGRGLGLHHLNCPDLVVYPENVEQIQWLCKYASEHQIPLIPYGLGSSVKGQTDAIQGGISIDMGRMNRVLEFHPENRTIRLQVGITKNALADYLAESDLFLPIEIGNCDASIGGMIGTNARGSMAAYYGSMRDFVLAVKVVTAEGNVLSTGRLAPCPVSGFNLNSLFIGAEGTLGVIVEATLKLAPIPRAITCAIATFDTLENALSSAVQIHSQGVSVQRCELIDSHTVASINAFHSTTFQEKPCLFIEAHANNRAAADSAIEECKDICRESGLLDYTQFTDDESEALPMLWTAKSTIWLSAIRRSPRTDAAIADVSVPMSRLKELVAFGLKSMHELKINWSAFVCQVGMGSVTLLLPCKSDDKSYESNLKTFLNRFNANALSLDGTITAQYCVGSEKREELEQEIGKEAIAVMRHLKRALDPKNILNPGKIFLFFD